jgi:ABC-2 type transport system permease protein
MLAMMGLILAGVMLVLAHHVWSIGDAVAGRSVPVQRGDLPAVGAAGFSAAGRLCIMPITYWLELLRRSLVGEVAEAFPTLQGLSNMQLLGILVGLTAVFALISAFPSIGLSRKLAIAV